jgi:hypothetical protein
MEESGAESAMVVTGAGGLGVWTSPPLSPQATRDARKRTWDTRTNLLATLTPVR